MTSFYDEIFVRVVRARGIWETMHMLLTNSQNNTMQLYCGKLPRMTNVQYKTPKKLEFHRLLITPPVQNTCLKNVNRTCQAFDKPA